LAYGGSIFKNGIHEQVIQAKGHEIVEFAGIEPNPHFETLMKVAVIKEQNIDFILAVGGGSVIDGVKFISAAVHLKGINGNSSKRLLIKDLSKVIPLEQY
jgi:NADP-dependent alcohol dehydrogenase